MAIKYLSKCIVCNVNFNSISNTNNDTNPLLENFCVYFNVSVKVNCLSSNQDYFCVKCKQIVVQLLDLYEQLLKIQTAVKKAESIIIKTILETGHNNIHTINNTNNQNEQPNTMDFVQTSSSNNDNNNIHTTTNEDSCHTLSDKVQPENSKDSCVSPNDDLIENGNVWRRQIKLIRRSICDSFLPTVLLFKFNKKNIGRRKSAIRIKPNKSYTKRRKSIKIKKSITKSTKAKPLSEQQLSFPDITENSNNPLNEADKHGHDEQGLLASDLLHSGSDFEEIYDGRRESDEEEGRKDVDEKDSRQQKKITTDHVCKLCGKTFKNRKNLEVHKGRHSKKFTQNCELCNKQFSSKQGLAIHMKTVHETTREYECHVCKLKVGTVTSLKRHLKTHESSKSKLGRLRRDLSQHAFDCELCESTFLNKQDRINHLNTVHNQETSSQNILKCEKCDKTFTKLKLLRRHMVSHSSNLTFMCFKCNKGFKTSHYLSAHIKRHDSIKKFSCNICNSKFKTKASLIFHQETVHEGKRRDFPCSVCSNRFTTSHAVKRHLLTHSQTRNFMCESCGSKFQQNSTLRRHISEVHLRIPPKTQRKTASQRRAAREAKLNQLQHQQNYSEYLQNNNSDSNNISLEVSGKMKVDLNSSSSVPVLESTILLQQQQSSSELATVSIGEKNLIHHDIRLVSVSNDETYQSIIPLSTTSIVVNDDNFEMQGISPTLQFPVPFSTSSNSTTTTSNQI